MHTRTFLSLLLGLAVSTATFAATAPNTKTPVDPKVAVTVAVTRYATGVFNPKVYARDHPGVRLTSAVANVEDTQPSPDAPNRYLSKGTVTLQLTDKSGSRKEVVAFDAISEFSAKGVLSVTSFKTR